MSRLYIRLKTNFYSHRKTAMLRFLIGESAFWVPPRLWAYCAENQADGDLSKYNSVQISMLIGYNGDANLMLEALKRAGFIDSSGFVHDWSDHNSYHDTFAARAKTAANARWSKQKTPAPPKEEESGNRKEESGDKHCSSIACSITADDIYAAYPRKVAKKDGLKAISKAMTKVDPEKLLKITKAYAVRRAGDLEFTPYPASWFNGERYNDDPSTWNTTPNGNHATKPNPRNFGIAKDPTEQGREIEEVLARRSAAAGNGQHGVAAPMAPPEHHRPDAPGIG